jgi:predicted dehydrogenase
MSQSGLTRRHFLQGTLAAAATVTIAGTKSSGRVLGANDTIRIAVAGLNGRGGSHVGEFAKMKGVEIVYLVDPDTRTYGKRIKQAEGSSGKTPKTVQDIRKALQDKNVDAVSIATPNHWHSLIAIWACQAGKDVYVEKPCSHNVFEGRIAVEAARKYNRIVQHGTQSRSDMGWANVVEVIRSGKLGKLLVSRGLCYKDGGKGHNTRGNLGFKPYKTPPAELDFSIWLGPAKEQPYHENLVHYRWHWFWDFGNGDMGNQGVHQMDIARWGIPGATLPRSVFSAGGRYVGPGQKDQGQVANTQICVYDYGDTQLIFETRGLPSKKYLGQGVGNIFHLEAGTIAGKTFYPKDSKKSAPLPKVEARRGPGGGNNFANFIAAVRSRRMEELNADILEGHLSSALCHLGNISYRLGKEVPCQPKPAGIDDKNTLEALARMEEHLGESGYKLGETKLRVGPMLKFDGKTEKFTGNEQATQMLTRQYRKPFAVPEKA